MKPLFAWLAAVLTLLPVTPAGSATAPCKDLELADAWVRVLPPTLGRTAAYLQFTNRGPESCAVTAVSADVAAVVEIHDTVDIDGLKRMQAIDQLEIPAGGTVQLSPGGLHLMLLELERMPAEGETVELCVDTAGEQQACTVAVARRDTGGDDSGHHHH